jgi:cytochrome o ubiquinol oxidase subunit 3
MSGAHAVAGPSHLLTKRIITGYGFWVFLLSDIIMFSAFFSTYAVLVDATAGGPSGGDLFNLDSVAVETACLLVSSFTCGIASIGAQRRNGLWFYGAMAATFVLGAIFLSLELREFSGMVADGAGPTRSAFLSAFFTLVGCHGLHVTGGLLWLLTMVAQVFAKGYRADIMRRLLCFSLFWHALDIIWVALFSVVYLMGAVR